MHKLEDPLDPAYDRRYILGALVLSKFYGCVFLESSKVHLLGWSDLALAKNTRLTSEQSTRLEESVGLGKPKPAVHKFDNGIYIRSVHNFITDLLIRESLQAGGFTIGSRKHERVEAVIAGAAQHLLDRVCW